MTPGRGIDRFGLSGRARAMYAGGRGNATARRWVHRWNRVFELGLFPRRWVVLEVAGRRTGRVIRTPVGMADVTDQWYLVSMLGECNWVWNVRAAGGQAVLRRRRPRTVRLVEVPVNERAPVIKRYVEKVPGGRPHIPVDRHQSVEAFQAVAADHPVFRVLDTAPVDRRPAVDEPARVGPMPLPSRLDGGQAQAMKTTTAAKIFLSQRRIAVTGVSRTPKDHGANVVYRRLRDRGYEVVPVNPHADAVEGDPCYADLRAIPDGVDAVVIATRPEHALETVKECLDLGIDKAWMHRGPGAGSVSPEATALGRQHGMLVIDGGCPCMFAPTSDPGHRVMRSVLTLTGAVPRTV